MVAPAAIVKVTDWLIVMFPLITIVESPHVVFDAIVPLMPASAGAEQTTESINTNERDFMSDFIL